MSEGIILPFNEAKKTKPKILVSNFFSFRDLLLGDEAHIKVKGLSEIEGRKTGPGSFPGARFLLDGRWRLSSAISVFGGGPRLRLRC